MGDAKVIPLVDAALARMLRLSKEGVPLARMKQVERIRRLDSLLEEVAQLADGLAAYAQSDEEETVGFHVKGSAMGMRVLVLALDNEKPWEGA